MDVQALGPLGTLATNGTQERGDVLQVEQIHRAGSPSRSQNYRIFEEFTLGKVGVYLR